MSDLKIAQIQSNLYWEDIGANLAMFEEKIWEINGQVDLILLPEMFNTGFSMNPKKLAEVPGLRTEKWLKQMAAQKKALVGGSYIVNDRGDYYNRFVAAFPDGSIQYYDKHHLFSLAKEEDFFTAGKQRMILEFRDWKICPLICYDLRFPAWAKNRYDPVSNTFEYDLLIYVASWPKPRIAAWDTLLQARAIENQCYVAGVNRVGTDANDHAYVGHTVLIDYSGEELEKIKNKEGMLVEQLSKESLEVYRKRYPFLADSDIVDVH